MVVVVSRISLFFYNKNTNDMSFKINIHRRYMVLTPFFILLLLNGIWSSNHGTLDHESGVYSDELMTATETPRDYCDYDSMTTFDHRPRYRRRFHYDYHGPFVHLLWEKEVEWKVVGRLYRITVLTCLIVDRFLNPFTLNIWRSGWWCFVFCLLI